MAVCNRIEGGRLYSADNKRIESRLNVTDTDLHRYFKALTLSLSVFISVDLCQKKRHSEGTDPNDPESRPPLKGDVNGDGNVDLADGVMALQIMAGANLQGAQVDADANGDNRIGIEEAIFLLQRLSGIKSSMSNWAFFRINPTTRIIQFYDLRGAPVFKGLIDLPSSPPPSGVTGVVFEVAGDVDGDGLLDFHVITDSERKVIFAVPE